MNRSMFRATLAAAGLFAALGAAQAETMAYKASLDGTSEVPPVTTKAMGTADVAYDTDTKTLSWTVSHEGLSGPATAAHFHGPASTSESAPPVVPIALGELTKGSAKLTDAQAQELMDGKMYLNIHTALHPNGEIRGQVMSAR